jgi:6-phosphogluconolactonase
MSTTKVVPGTLIATPDAAGVARESAMRMSRAIREAIDGRGRAAIALSGGNTPRAAYHELAGDGRIAWSKVDVFWVDERAVPPNDDRSNYKHAKEMLLDAAQVPAGRVHRMTAELPDLDGAARSYEALLRARVGFVDRDVPVLDLVVLGVGDDGHTASLFPGEPVVGVRDKLVAAVPAKGAREARLTLTAPVIEAARAVVVLAVGKAKNAPLERVWLVAGDTDETPARVIRDVRGAVTWVIDQAAGGIE